MDPDSSSGSSQPPATSHLPLKAGPRHRHISRSAAKRESVQLLGSIKDLQLHFSRAGLVEHRPGSGVGVKSRLGDLGEEDDEEDTENRPPASSSYPSHGSHTDSKGGSREQRERKPWKDVELSRVDVSQAREEVRGLLGVVKGMWGLGLASSPSGLSPVSPMRATRGRIPTDTRTLLVTTAQTIRRVRSLSLAVSHAQGRRQLRQSSGGAPVVHLSAAGGSKRARTSISTPSRPNGGLPRAVSHGTGPGASEARKSSLAPQGEDGRAREDELGELRKAALEVLAGLRALEEILRVERVEQAEGGREGAFSPVSHVSTTSSSLRESTSTPPTSTRPESSSAVYSEPDGYDSQVDDDEDAYDLNALAREDEARNHLTWEERIGQEGREYRSVADEGGAEGREEVVRECVRRWAGKVEGVFEVNGAGEVEGHDAARDLADWARDVGWNGKQLERVHAFLLGHLPLDLLLLLPPTTSASFRVDLLSHLSDGLILIHAFNAAVLTSAKPWGFIPSDDIHDTLSGAHGVAAPDDEVKRSEKEWTFRRVGNLTSWAAAVKLRYQLPLHIPSQSTTSTFLPVPAALPQRSTSPGSTPPMPHAETMSRRRSAGDSSMSFDPLVVAKRSEGWEGMLAGVVERWVEAVAREAREAAAVDETVAESGM